MLGKKPIIVIAGATASGKSDVSIDLASRINAEVVVADSMQVYKDMDIGTAKVAQADRKVAHHCIDLVDPSEQFSSALYQQYARDAFADIESREKMAILSGGTGFYIRAAIDDYEFAAGEQKDNPIRAEHARIISESGSYALWEILRDVDPESASDIHPNNSKRVSRALEMHAAGESYHDQLNKLSQIRQLYDAKFFCIDVDRDVLCKRIETRVNTMLDKGLVDEVQSLIARGYRNAVTANAAIGYKEIVSALDGEISLEEAKERIIVATRRYAKRQRSWFRSDSRYVHIDGTDGDIFRITSQIYESIS